MTTGDGLTTARAVGARLRIDEVHGEVKPADKLALVEKLQKEGHVVAMAGAGGRGPGHPEQRTHRAGQARTTFEHLLLQQCPRIRCHGRYLLGDGQ